MTSARATNPSAVGRSILPAMAAMAAMCSFQLGNVLVKQLYPVMGWTGAASLRLALGAVLLAIVVRPWRTSVDSSTLPSLLALGCSMAGAVLLFYAAIARLPLGVAMALQFLGPLAVAGATSRRVGDLACVALAALGVWLLVATGRMSSTQDWLGVLAALGAAACWAGYLMFGRTASLALGASAGAYGVAIAALLVLPFGAEGSELMGLPAELLGVAVGVAILSTALPFWLEFFALPRLPAPVFATLMSLEPAIGLLIGVVLLGEVVDAFQAAGVVAVVVAAAGIARSAAAD